MLELSDKITGGTLTAVEWSNHSKELENVITKTGGTLNNSDDSLVKAIDSIAKTSLYTDSGGVNSVVLTRTLTGVTTIETLFNGMSIFFTPNNINTGASTLNINGLGNKPLIFNGSPLTANFLNPNNMYIAHYNGTSFEMYNLGMINVKAVSTLSIDGLKQVKLDDKISIIDDKGLATETTIELTNGGGDLDLAVYDNTGVLISGINYDKTSDTWTIGGDSVGGTTTATSGDIWYDDSSVTPNQLTMTRGLAGDTTSILVSGIGIVFTPNTINTGATNLNLNAIGNVEMIADGSPLVANYLQQNNIYISHYNGTNWVTHNLGVIDVKEISTLSIDGLKQVKLDDKVSLTHDKGLVSETTVELTNDSGDTALTVVDNTGTHISGINYNKTSDTWTIGGVNIANPSSISTLWYADSSTTTSVITLTIALIGGTAITAYETGMTVVFKPSNVNTDATTVTVDGLGVKDIKDGLNATATNFFNSENTYIAWYNGTYFEAYCMGVQDVPLVSTLSTNGLKYTSLDGSQLNLTNDKGLVTGKTLRINNYGSKCTLTGRNDTGGYIDRSELGFDYTKGYWTLNNNAIADIIPIRYKIANELDSFLSDIDIMGRSTAGLTLCSVNGAITGDVLIANVRLQLTFASVNVPTNNILSFSYDLGTKLNDLLSDSQYTGFVDYAYCTACLQFTAFSLPTVTLMGWVTPSTGKISFASEDNGNVGHGTGISTTSVNKFDLVFTLIAPITRDY